MTTHVELDFETRSTVNLKTAGAWRYSIDASTEVYWLSYSLDRAPPRLWFPGMPEPYDLFQAIRDGALLTGHNVAFEYCIWANVMAPQYDWITPDEDQWDCTMAMALAKGLPGALDKAGEVLDLPVQKDAEGHKVMLKLCKPRRHYRDDLTRDPKFHEEEGDLFRAGAYCCQDTRAEQCLGAKVGRLTPQERRVWLMDQRMNRWGVHVDLPLVGAAMDVIGEVKRDLTAELADVTGGAVTSGSQVKLMREWLEQNGCSVPNLRAETVDSELRHDDVEGPARRVLEIRQSLSKASTSKLKAILNCVDPGDSRIRYSTQYYGASSTGRWAGRLWQPQNLPRPDPAVVGKEGNSELVADIMRRDAHLLDEKYGDAMNAVSSALRGVITAADDHELAWADFSGIEVCVLMRVAEQWGAVEALRTDPGQLYLDQASQIFGRPITRADDAERQVGKVGILGLGFGMGTDKHYDDGLEKGADPAIWTHEMAERSKLTYRHTYAEVPRLWYGLEAAAVKAMRTRKPQEYKGIVYRLERDGEWLTCLLPSGRKLWYRDPRLEITMTPWGEEKLQLVYKAWKFGQWRDVHAYGALQTENVVQATARDIMVDAMFRAEKAALPLVLTIHDEIITEPLAGVVRPEVLEELMCESEDWCADYPISAEAIVKRRYDK